MGRRWKTGMRHWDAEEMEDGEMGRQRRWGCGTEMRRRWKMGRWGGGGDGGWEPTEMERWMRMDRLRNQIQCEVIKRHHDRKSHTLRAVEDNKGRE
ncbi:unnamed protein product [Miscanthus lutarioriparius]|uniref:Uncharacterized protein n=1 Tax=Miscanthus lutarioriparius TaxID=422564 RepID=A0A811NBE1_9POAL|nr:unnamed protein product [Miscanthus lutarioriparius]